MWLDDLAPGNELELGNSPSAGSPYELASLQTPAGAGTNRLRRNEDGQERTYWRQRSQRGGSSTITGFQPRDGAAQSDALPVPGGVAALYLEP